MQFNFMKHEANEEFSKATITLTAAEIREIAEGLRLVGEKTRLRSEWFLLYELVMDGAVDDQTFVICRQLRGTMEDDAFVQKWAAEHKEAGE